LTKSLLADGPHVLRLTRGGISGDDTIGWDPEAGRIDAPALEGIDAIVHLAGEGIGERRWSDEQKKKILDSRVRGTAVLAAAVASRERKPRVFVSGSAIGYYGSCGNKVLTEESPPGTDFLAQVCVAWEAQTKAASEAGVRTVHARTGIVLDAHGGALAKMLLPFKMGIGGRQGSGKQWMSWVALADQVAAIRHAIDNDAVSGPINIVAPNPVTNADFAHTLGEALHRPTVLPTPLLPLKVRLGSELVESLLLGSQRGKPARLEASGYQFQYPTLDAALHAILHEPKNEGD
jgi:uncharacterized protein (TIGR01777 family)